MASTSPTSSAPLHTAASPTLAEVRRRLRALADPADATFLQGFFKTGPGQYGEGDVFLGVRVPAVRRLVPEAAALPRPDVLDLLASPVHEERLLALLTLVRQFDRGDAAARRELHRLYLAHTRHVNNWDLVDTSAPTLVGAYLAARARRPLALLSRLARSRSLWERRIAMVATFHFTRQGDVAPTLAVAALLLGDAHDLIHKAVGWMLREAGKRDPAGLETFLGEHLTHMPRTALRYAIERLPEARRRGYLSRKRIAPPAGRGWPAPPPVS